MNEASLKQISYICKLTKDEVLALLPYQINTLISRDIRLKELFQSLKGLTVNLPTIPPVSIPVDPIKLTEDVLTPAVRTVTEPVVTLTSTPPKVKRKYNRKVVA